MTSPRISYHEELEAHDDQNGGQDGQRNVIYVPVDPVHEYI